MIRNIAVVMRGTVLAQAVGVVILPLLTRLFDPSAFGHLQLYLSVLTLLIVIPSLRYDVAILRAADTELPALLRLCVYANLGVMLLFLVVAYGGAALLPESILATAPFPLWMPIVAMAISGVAQVLLYVATRDERFAVNANSKIAQSLSYAGTSVGMGAGGVSVNGLVIADMAGRVVNLGWLFRWFRSRPVMPRQGRASIRTVAHRYREYPLIALPGGVVNSLGGTLTPIMIYATFTAATAGQYGLVDRVLNMPVALIAIAVSQAYMGQLSSALRVGAADARTQFHAVLKWLTLIGIIPAIGAVLLARPVFVLLFGREWALAGVLAQILIPAAFTSLLAGCFNMTLTVVGRQKTQIAWEMGRLAAMAALWSLVSLWHLSVTTSVLLHSGLVMVANAIFLLLCEHALRRPVNPVDTTTVIESEAA